MEQFTALWNALRDACPALELRVDEPMKNHTTFHIGGPGRLMALPRSEEEAVTAVRLAAELGVVPMFLGNGSNLLVADGGVDGFLIKAVDGLDALSADGTVLHAGSGVLLPQLACFARDHGLSGLEFAQGIPGSLGGAVTMNAGAYGGEMANLVTAVRYLTVGGETAVLCGADLDFSYRHSAFDDGTRMILSADLTLLPGDSATIGAQMETLMGRRRSKQPLDYPSGGSTFKRPENYFAAALIDQCGLKGTVIGGAEVSKRHAGFLINRGDASCADVMALAELVRETVLRETGVPLELELKTLGIAD